MNQTNQNDSITVVSQTANRRSFLKKSAFYSVSLPLLAACGNQGVGDEKEGDKEEQRDLAPGEIIRDSNASGRIEQCFQTRVKAAQNQRDAASTRQAQVANDDDERYANEGYYASFTKTLPSNRFGEVEAAAYQALLKAVSSQNQSDFKEVRLSSQATRKLANPQGAMRIALNGADGHTTRMLAAPSFNSAESATEMVELYWQALTRDIPFEDFSENSLISQAIADLQSMSHGIGKSGPSQSTIFRLQEIPGADVGPYISQFLWQKVDFGPSKIEQKFNCPVAEFNHMTDLKDWLLVQKGGVATSSSYEDNGRYIHNGRSLANYVHRDVSFQAYLNAALIMLGYGSEALASTNPYHNDLSAWGFTSFGGPFVLDLVTRAANLALSGAWYQKWNVHRRLRPETFAGRVHFNQTDSRSYDIHTDLLDSRALSETYSRTGTYLLSQAYPEGSPTHPSYPAGHASIAGACATILKACFNENFVIQSPVVASRFGDRLERYQGSSQLTLGGEINKLATNVSMGRDTAGVHYRSDSIGGMEIGEQQAISLLQDVSLTTSEAGSSFELTKFDGARIRISNGIIVNI